MCQAGRHTVATSLDLRDGSGKKKIKISGEGRFKMQGLLSLSRTIDAINTWIGRNVAWLILVAVLISTVNAIIRKLFNISSNGWLEAQWVLFGAVFLLCSPWTLLSHEHIRIDIVNNLFPRWLKHWIDLFGHVFFLMPFALIMIIDGWPFFMESYRINEGSLNAGGLVQWPAKSLLVIGFTLLAIQGISEIIKRIALMRGLIPDTTHTGLGGGHGAAAEAEALRLLEQAKLDGLAPIALADPGPGTITGTIPLHGIKPKS
jgi:TRAP-type mannitol/chloroaromatic compound transport system permease small subunit